MPIYEYRCDSCGKKASLFLGSYASPEPACPNCGKRELRRLVSTFATTSSGDGGDDFGGGDDDFGGADDDFGGGDDFGGADDDF